MVDFLTTEVTDSNYSIMVTRLVKLYQKFGAVSRGVCKVDAAGNLEEIIERTKVYPKDGNIFYEENGEEFPLSYETPVR